MLVWADYGDSFWWEGTASRAAGLLVAGVDPHGVGKDMGDPEAEEPRPVHDGRPDWVPASWGGG